MKKESEYSKIKNFFRSLEIDGWKTPDTYCKYFSPLPKKSGIYALIYIDIESLFYDQKPPKIMYVGMSKNISNRLVSHPILRELKDKYIQCWFKECPEEKLRSLERETINRFDPPFNIIGRKRGL